MDESLKPNRSYEIVCNEEITYKNVKMKNKDQVREKILNQPSYWVEDINAFVYNAVLEYMELNNMNRTKLAEHLGLFKGRISQILNNGEINFSIEKLVQIALKVDKFPIFELKDKKEYFRDDEMSKKDVHIMSL